jgi:hypothetical protein
VWETAIPPAGAPEAQHQLLGALETVPGQIGLCVHRLNEGEWQDFAVQEEEEEAWRLNVGHED